MQPKRLNIFGIDESQHTNLFGVDVEKDKRLLHEKWGDSVPIGHVINKPTSKVVPEQTPRHYPKPRFVRSRGNLPKFITKGLPGLFKGAAQGAVERYNESPLGQRAEEIKYKQKLVKIERRNAMQERVRKQLDESQKRIKHGRQKAAGIRKEPHEIKKHPLTNVERSIYEP